MKKLIFTISTFLLVTTNSSALDFTPFSDFTRVIKDEIHLTTVAVTPLSVRCSMIGYGLSELKLNIPSLRWHAVLDHSNGENLGSCVTAGPKFCEFGNMPKIPDGFFVNDTPNVETEMRVIGQMIMDEGGYWEVIFGGMGYVNLPKKSKLNVIDELNKLIKAKQELKK